MAPLLSGRVEAAASLAECRALRGLRSLRLGQGWMGVGSLQMLAESPHLVGLEQLGMAFDYENVGDGGAELFAHRLPALRWLDLSSSRIGPATALGPRRAVTLCLPGARRSRIVALVGGAMAGE